MSREVGDRKGRGREGGAGVWGVQTRVLYRVEAMILQRGKICGWMESRKANLLHSHNITPL